MKRPIGSVAARPTLPSSLFTLHYLLSLPGNLPLQERPNLLRPIDILQEHHRHFHFFQVLPFQPDVEEALRHEAVEPGLVSIVAGHVGSLFQFKEDVEEPGAVFVEEGLLHGEHIQDMELSPVHDGGKGIGVTRVLFNDNTLCLVQILFIMGMLVLTADGLDVVVPLLRKDDVVLLQEPFIVFPMENGFLLLFDILRMGFLAEIPPIMAETYIVTIQVLPGPVKPRKLAEMRILCGNVVSGVVGGVAEGGFSCGPYL